MGLAFNLDDAIIRQDGSIKVPRALEREREGEKKREAEGKRKR